MPLPAVPPATPPVPAAAVSCRKRRLELSRAPMSSSPCTPPLSAAYDCRAPYLTLGCLRQGVGRLSPRAGALIRAATSSTTAFGTSGRSIHHSARPARPLVSSSAVGSTCVGGHAVAHTLGDEGRHHLGGALRRTRGGTPGSRRRRSCRERASPTRGRSRARSPARPRVSPARSTRPTGSLREVDPVEERRQVLLVAGQQCEVEVLLGVEVAVDHRLGHVRGGCDVLHPCARVAVGREQATGREGDQLAPLIAGDSLGLRGDVHGYRRVTPRDMLPVGNDERSRPCKAPPTIP